MSNLVFGCCVERGEYFSYVTAREAAKPDAVPLGERLHGRNELRDSMASPRSFPRVSFRDDHVRTIKTKERAHFDQATLVLVLPCRFDAPVDQIRRTFEYHKAEPAGAGVDGQDSWNRFVSETHDQAGAAAVIVLRADTFRRVD